MPALYAGKRVGKPLLNGHTYNALFNGKLVWPLDKDTVVSIEITDDKGKPLPKSLAVSGTLKLGAKATYADGHVGDLLTTKDVTFMSRDTSTATVNTDGSLHVTGTATRQWAGLVWTFPCPVQGTVILRNPTGIAGLYPSVKFLDAKGHQLDGQVTSGGNAVAIPAGTVSLRFEILSNEATPTAKDGDLRIQLESGTTAHDWMRPDNTSLRGGR